jgi:hypothetical protein
MFMMIQIDGNMSKLLQIVCKKYNLNINKFIGFIMWILFNSQTWITFKNL